MIEQVRIVIICSGLCKETAKIMYISTVPMINVICFKSSPKNTSFLLAPIDKTRLSYHAGEYIEYRKFSIIINNVPNEKIMFKTCSKAFASPIEKNVHMTPPNINTRSETITSLIPWIK